jgi:hypothetical protein
MNQAKMAGKAFREPGKAVNEASPWIDKLARLGYAAKGSVYAIIGILAIMTASGFGGELTDKKGAVAAIRAQPLGSILLVILAVGLAAYFVWSTIQALMDPDGYGSDWKGKLKRLGTLGGGIIYGGLAFTAIRTISTSGKTGGGNEQSMSAEILQKPLGATIIAIVGAAVFGYGMYQLVKAYRTSFTKRFKKDKMSPAVYKAFVSISRFGIATRGVVFGLIGYFLIRTAVQSDPSETKGLDEALAELAKQPYGRYLLGAAALGVFAYGLYLFVLARYRTTVSQDRRD